MCDPHGPLGIDLDASVKPVPNSLKSQLNAVPLYTMPVWSERKP